MPRAQTADAVAALRERDGETLVFGSRTLWTAPIAHGLVDVLHLMIGPKIVAGDHRAFDGAPATDLHLLGARRLDASGIVLLSHALPTRS